MNMVRSHQKVSTHTYVETSGSGSGCIYSEVNTKPNIKGAQLGSTDHFKLWLHSCCARLLGTQMKSRPAKSKTQRRAFSLNTLKEEQDTSWVPVLTIITQSFLTAAATQSSRPVNSLCLHFLLKAPTNFGTHVLLWVAGTVCISTWDQEADSTVFKPPWMAWSGSSLSPVSVPLERWDVVQNAAPLSLF